MISITILTLKCPTNRATIDTLALGASFSSSAVSVADESYSSLLGLLGATASVLGAGAGAVAAVLGVAGEPPLAVSVSAELNALSSLELSRGTDAGRSPTKVSNCSFFLSRNRFISKVLRISQIESPIKG